MGLDDIFDVSPPIKEFVDFHVVVIIIPPRLGTIILLKKETRRSQHDARQPMASVEQFTQVLRCGLCNTVDVSRDRADVLGYPDRRRAHWRSERPTKRACR